MRGRSPGPAGLLLPEFLALAELFLLHQNNDAQWSPAAACPCRVGYFPQGRSYTGHDLVEVVVPGSPFLVDIALQVLQEAGAEAAGPGPSRARPWLSDG